MSILSSRQAILLASVSFVGLAASGNLALANPEGGTVEAGSATIGNADKNTLEINQQSQRAIINWDSFSIGEGETTRFILPNSQSVTLNRDLGGARSEIHGNIESNGRFFLVNPNGILFGPGSRVDVAGLVATTHNIRSQDFMAGRYEFNIPGQPDASVITQGEVSIQDLGFGAFVAPHVRNEGVIAARMGRVELASASGFTLDMHGDRLISFLVENPNEHQIFDSDGNSVSALVENHGAVIADGGVVAMSASAARGVVDSVINTDGIVQANTVEQRGGKIILGGGSTGAVRTSGQVQARGENPGERGGRIEVTGEAVIAEGNSEIDASGMDGGGTILFGGDYLGGNTSNADILHLGITLEDEKIPTSRFAFVDDGVRMSVDALGHGDGGKLIVWSDEATLSYANLSARGGVEGGDGGFIETSGKLLQLGGVADASAPLGRAGTWLLDPLDIAIDTTTNGEAFFDPLGSISLIRGGSIPSHNWWPTGSPSIIAASFIETSLNAGTNVGVLTFGTEGSGDGNIFLRTDIRKTSGGDARLFLGAEGSVFVSAGVNVTSTSGALDLDMFGDNIVAGNMGQLELNGGTLFLTPRFGASLSTSSPMPDVVEVYHRNEALVGAVGRVDLQFGQDRVDYTYSEDSLIYRTGAIDLRDSRSQGNLRMIFSEEVDAVYHNYAIRYDANHAFSISGLRSQGAAIADALDGIPEIVGVNLFSQPTSASDTESTPEDGPTSVTGVAAGFSGPPILGNNRGVGVNPDLLLGSNNQIPVLEIVESGQDLFRTTHNSGVAILEAHLDAIAPPAPEPTPPSEPAFSAAMMSQVEQVVQQAKPQEQPFIGPTQPRRQEVIFGIPEMNSGIPIAMDLGEIAQTTIAFDALRLIEEPSALAVRHAWAIDHALNNESVQKRIEKLAEKYAFAAIGATTGSVLGPPGAVKGFLLGYYSAVFKQEYEEFISRQMMAEEVGASKEYVQGALMQSTNLFLTGFAGNLPLAGSLIETKIPLLDVVFLAADFTASYAAGFVLAPDV